jgi:signal peptidase I
VPLRNRSDGGRLLPRIARRFAAVVLTAAAAAVVLLAGLVLSGRLTVVITHGVSMQPLYHQGDLVVVQQAPSYQVGQVVAYRVPSRHLLVLHRLIAERQDHLAFKGDNNQSVDPWHPEPAQLVGHAIVHIPQGGLWLQRATSPPVISVAAGLLLVGGGADYGRRRRRRRMPAHTRNVRTRTASLTPTTPPGWGGVLAALAITAVAGLALTGLAWTSPRTELVTVTKNHQRRMDFAYRAQVKPSAAYAGTTVHSPDPVFRRLAHTVQVQYRYAGPPGTVNVVARLSAPGGWHTRIPLAVDSGTGGTGGTVTLDLPALDATAAAAAAATGVPTTPLSVAVVPTVTTATGQPFTPALELNLTPAQLSLVDGGRSLTVFDSVPVSRQERQPRRFTVRRLAVTDSSLRIIGLLILGLAAAGGGIAAIAERRLGRAAPAEAVRRHYGVPVLEILPITGGLDRPVIQLRTVADLVQLSTRLALPVLHWSDAGADIFAVHDEFVIYRAAITTLPETMKPPPLLPAGNPLVAEWSDTASSAPREQVTNGFPGPEWPSGVAGGKARR